VKELDSVVLAISEGPEPVVIEDDQDKRLLTDMDLWLEGMRQKGVFIFESY
jgi:hypothetical protein